MRIPIFKIATIAISLLLSLASTAQVKDTVQSDNYVVMLSLDGFRWDYSTLYKTPNLNQIATNGVKADAMISCYPSKTFPITIVWLLGFTQIIMG